jgi:hypothetical protein
MLFEAAYRDWRMLGPEGRKSERGTQGTVARPAANPVRNEIVTLLTESDR